jgi:hypothetical protein
VVGAAVASITNGRCQHVSLTTSGNNFLFIANGVDNLQRFDGTTWTAPATYVISGGGTLNTNTIFNLNVFKRRLFFLVNQSLDFYYFDIDAAAGTVTRFPLGALASKGGRLVAMGTWTVDGGEGVDDYAVFATSEGQLIVYKGTDPNTAATWALQGVYDLGKPLGSKCFLKFGGDLLYLCDDGLYPLSRALLSSNIDGKAAVTERISTAFAQAAKQYKANFGWQIIFSLTDSLLLVNIPQADLTTSIQFVMNTKTGAWTQFSGWDFFCWALLGDQLYAGMAGKVAQAWIGVSDFNQNITAYCKTAFDYFGRRTRLKHIKQLRPLFLTQGSVSIDVQIDVDFADNNSHGPVIFPPQTGSLWNSALWNSGVWQGAAAPRLDWRTVASYPGFCAALRLRIVSKTATVEWSSTDFLFELGAIR